MITSKIKPFHLSVSSFVTDTARSAKDGKPGKKDDSGAATTGPCICVTCDKACHKTVENLCK